MEQVVISLARCFNDPFLSDIQIFASREANAPSFYCHEALLRLRSPKFVDSLADRRVTSDSTKKVIIVEELEGKADLAQLFLRVLYDETAWDDDKCYPLLDVFLKYELYAFARRLKTEVPEEAETGKHFFELGRIMHDAMPAANSENSHEGDLLVKLKDTEYAYHCHSIVLAQGLEYFQGLFRSGMKDSRAREVTIELHAEVAPDVFKIAFETLLHYVYRGFMNAVPSQEAFVVTYSLAVKYITPQLEAELLRKVPFVSNTKSIGPIIYSAMVYNAQPLLDKVTTVLIPKFTQSAAEESFTVVPKEYLLEFNAGTPRKNAFQYAVDSQLDSQIVKALENIHSILGEDPKLNLNTVDERGNTLLHLAVNGAERPHTVEYLVGKGLSINATNNDGLTPMGVILSQAEKTEFELQFPLAQLLRSGATFDETKPELVRAFVTIAAQFDMKNEICQIAWPIAQKIIVGLPHKVFQDEFGLKTLRLALSCKNFLLVDYLVFTAKVPTSRSVTILKHHNDGMPRNWLPEHDDFDFSILSNSSFKLNSKTYSMKGAEIFVSQDNYGSGSYEARPFVYDQLNVHTKDRPNKPLEFHGSRGAEWQALLNLLQFLWVKSNVPEERQVLAFTAPIREGHLQTREEIQEGLGNVSQVLSSIGQIMSNAINIPTKK
jgi:hypothetical protein